jgi:hypothetical protein
MDLAGGAFAKGDAAVVEPSLESQGKSGENSSAAMTLTAPITRAPVSITVIGIAHQFGPVVISPGHLDHMPESFWAGINVSAITSAYGSLWGRTKAGSTRSLYGVRPESQR